MNASYQTVQLCRLIWVFLGCSYDIVGSAVLQVICDFDFLSAQTLFYWSNGSKTLSYKTVQTVIRHLLEDSGETKKLCPFIKKDM